jgi:vacuolar-type H+-ATPase subunit H
MEKVIGLLFDIEKKANQIIERANDEKNELFEENEKAIAKMEADIAEKNHIKIERLLAQAEQEIEVEKQHLMECSKKQLADLEASYEKNHNNLVEKVYQSIIKHQAR